MTGVRAAIFDLDVVIAGLAPPNSDSARVRVRAFPSTVILVNRLRDAGLATALVTASRNSAAVLEAAGVLDLFDVVVDGNDAERLGLRGKPDPDFLARRPAGWRTAADCLVVEDAVAGVQAAREGGFAVVVGVDRTGNRTRLDAAGASVVVSDLATLDLRELLRLDQEPASGSVPWRAGASADQGPWVLTYHGFDPAQEGTRETLCTLANGYLGTRGAAPECGADAVHYPGTYLAGVYNRLQTALDGQTLEDEHLVNAPNWLPLRFAPADGEWLTLDSAELVDYGQELDLRRGVLTRDMRFRDASGRTLRVHSERLVSRAAPHLAALRTTFEAENWSGPLRVRSDRRRRRGQRRRAGLRPL